MALKLPRHTRLDVKPCPIYGKSKNIKLWGFALELLSLEMHFKGVVGDCLKGNTTKEQGRQLLDYTYISASEITKEKLEKYRAEARFYRYVPCDFDEWVDICDNTTIKPFPENKQYNDEINLVIEKYEAIFEKLDLEANHCAIEVFREVFHIRKLCRESREITGLYEKYKVEMDALPDVKRQQATEQLNTPEKIQAEIEKILSILCLEKYIKKTKWETGVEYHATASVPEIQTALKMKKEDGTITFTETNDIDSFMIKYLRFPDGKSMKKAIETYNKRQKKKTP